MRILPSSLETGYPVKRDLSSNTQPQCRIWWPVLLLIPILPLSLPAAIGQEEKIEPSPPQPHISSTEELEQLAGERILQDFRRQRLGGDYSFKFELKHMPRRGPTSIHHGQLWGTWSDSGARTRILFLGTGSNEVGTHTAMLVHNGPQPRVWSLGRNSPQEARELGGEELFEPIFPELVVSPFDLQMPFIYWPTYVFEGKSRKLGRTVFAFLMYPPETVKKQNPVLGAVRILLEEKSRQWLKAELIDREGQPLKSFKIISVKRMGQEGFPKTIDFFDERTRSKTRFLVLAAALGQNFPKDNFSPDRLAGEIPKVSPEAFTYLK